jgi:hypothetical protein
MSSFEEFISQVEHNLNELNATVDSITSAQPQASNGTTSPKTPQRRKLR